MNDITELKFGMTVQIRRTDGRTHPGVVSGINHGLRSATIEWIEDGETKGKEINFEDIFALNSNLQPPNKKYQAEKTDNKGKLSLPLVGNRRLRPPRATITTACIQTTSRRNSDVRSVSSQNIVGGARSSVSISDTIPRGSKPRSRSSMSVKEADRTSNKQESAIMQKKPLTFKTSTNPNFKFSIMINEYRSKINFEPLRENDIVNNNQIVVCVRKRPLNKQELLKKELDVITVPNKDTIVVHEPKHKVDLTKFLENQQFKFDYVFDEHCGNEIIYKFTAKPLIQTIFEGGMATCFAYGQTGSGKTHTMGGTYSRKIQDSKEGIYAFVAKDIFDYIHTPNYKFQNIIVTVSFFEIYGGRVYDLLAEKALLRVLEDGKQQVQVVGLKERAVYSVDDVLSLIQIGNRTRTTGSTSVNSNSSRSHAVFQITLRLGASHKVHGKFSLIDLAGNERGADIANSDRGTRMESAEINKYLLALKECIRALGRKGAHLPFRGSKLTQVLRDSFIGENSKTCMIAMISPGMSCCEYTLNTLRYADRVKELATSTDESQLNLSYENDHFSDVDMEETLTTRAGDQATIHEVSTEYESELSELKQEMLDDFKSWQEKSLKWSVEERSLLAASNNVTFDQSAFAYQLHSVVTQRMSALNLLDEKVCAFKKKLAEHRTTK